MTGSAPSGRTTFPLPAAFPFTACDALLTTSAFPSTYASASLDEPRLVIRLAWQHFEERLSVKAGSLE